MQVQAGVPMSTLTTLRVGGPAKELVEATTTEEMIEAVRDTDLPILVVAGGSNLLVSDSGFDGRVVVVKTQGIEINGTTVDAQAGVVWDDLVALTLAEGLSGFETLSGIPGCTGATPVQNVGAYGEEIATTFVALNAYDRTTNEVVTFTSDECGFDYRTSHFKRNDRYVILSVRFSLTNAELSVPLTYAELARTLDVEINERAPLGDVRNAVLGLRAGKGMVLDPGDSDTYSAGSFFTNPIVPLEVFEGIGDEPPHWLLPNGEVKVSAGWLIRNAGFDRGYQLGNARLSKKHALALTNAGDATADEIAELARRIKSEVEEQFGITLHPEPVLVGVDI